MAAVSQQWKRTVKHLCNIFHNCYLMTLKSPNQLLDGMRGYKWIVSSTLNNFCQWNKHLKKDEWSSNTLCLLTSLPHVISLSHSSPTANAMLGCLTAGLDFSINLSPMTCPEAEKTVSQRTVSMILSIAFTFDQWQPEIKTPAWHLRPTVAQFPKSISNPHFRQTTSKLRWDTSWNHTTNNLFYHKNRWISFRLARQWYPKLVLSDLKDWQRRRNETLSNSKQC